MEIGAVLEQSTLPYFAIRPPSTFVRAGARRAGFRLYWAVAAPPQEQPAFKFTSQYCKDRYFGTKAQLPLGRF
jgi:hypothetical protein